MSSILDRFDKLPTVHPTETCEKTEYERLFHEPKDVQDKFIAHVLATTTIPVVTYQEALKASFLALAAEKLSQNPLGSDEDSYVLSFVMSEANRERKLLGAHHDLFTIPRAWREPLLAIYRRASAAAEYVVQPKPAITPGPTSADTPTRSQVRARRGNAELARLCKAAYTVYRAKKGIDADTPLSQEQKTEALTLLEQ